MNVISPRQVEDTHDRKLAEATIGESEAFARSVLDNCPDCIEVLDLNGRLLFMNGPGLRAMEIQDFARVGGHLWQGEWADEGAATVSDAVNEARAGRPARFIGFRPTAKGTPKWWDICVSPIPGPEGEPSRLLAVSRDVTQSKRAQNEIEQVRGEVQAAAKRFSAVLESTTDAVILLDRNGRMTYVNQHAAAMLAARGLKLGGCLADAFSEADWCSFDLHFGLAMAEQMPVAFEESIASLGLWLKVHAYPTSEGDLSIFICDITEQRKAERERLIAQERIEHMARHDALTGLPNRIRFREHMEHVLLRARRGSGAALLCLDLDRFKEINDALGHPVGDELLCAVAGRLKECARESDLIARLGGDEFAIIQEGVQQPTDATALSDRLVEALKVPFAVHGERVVIGASIGIALVDGRATADDLLRNADIAMYRAKASGRGTWRFFEPAMDAEMQARHTMEADLRRALDEGQFEVFYQPLIHASTETLSGFEALLRWQHPERGMVAPAEFIAVAEEMGLIKAIGAWVLQRACTDAAAWPKHVSVAVNLSPAQFVRSTLVHEVEQALTGSGLAAGRLELEITESVLLQDNDATLGILHRLRALGVRISMDDFGTGYSSLSYLRRFPFDKIKIDKSFVQDYGQATNSVEIIRAAVGLGHALNMLVLAEGVETVDQLRMLQKEGCDELQGYLFSKPQPLREAVAFIASYATAGRNAGALQGCKVTVRDGLHATLRMNQRSPNRKQHPFRHRKVEMCNESAITRAHRLLQIMSANSPQRDAPVLLMKPPPGVDALSKPDELDTATVSRMLAGSRNIPFALLREGRFVFANPAFRSLFRADNGIIGKPLAALVAAQGRADIGNLLSDPAETAVTLQGRASRFDGSSFDVQLLLARETLDGVPMLYIFAEDVTSRQASESHLSYLAFTDLLTGLPNRALVLDRIRDALVDARYGDSGLAVFMADLDGLKSTNDTYGHQAGDLVLQVMAQRFLGCIRGEDTLARLGGDEFCILLPRIRDAGGAGTIAARLVEAASQPIPINGQDVRVGVSVGIALFPDHGTTGDALVAAADAALYEAKRGGRSRFAVASRLCSPVVVPLPLIVWTATHDVGIAMMDKQHRKLADHLNDLAASLRRGDETNIISEKLAATLAHTQHHFESEERLMAQHGFADAAAHREDHARLLEDLRRFSTGCDTRSLSLTTRFLQEWMLRHINNADRELAKALIASGVH